MSKKNYNNKANYNSRSSTFLSINNKLALLPLIITISVIPLIVRLKIYNCRLSNFLWYTNNDQQSDFYLYYKSLIFVLITAIMGIFIIWKLISIPILKSNKQQTNIFKSNNKYRFTIAFIPLAAYAILSILSTIFSKYLSFGISGVYDQFESIFVILGYCIVVLYAFLFVQTENDLKLIIKYLIISVIILCLIGFTQAAGHDIFSTTIMQKLVIPRDLWGIINNLDRHFEDNRVYLTLFNPNYVGSYTALILPIILILLFFSTELKYKIIYLFTFISLLLCLIGSLSRAGFVALCVSFLVIFVLFRKYFLRYWKVSAGIIGIFIIGFIIINAFMNNVFTNRLTSTFSNVRTPEYSLSSILTNKDNVAVTYKGSTFYIQALPNDENSFNFIITDSDNKNISIIYDQVNKIYTIDDSRFNSISIKDVTFEIKNSKNETTNLLGFNILIDGNSWIFTNQINDGTYFYYNAFGKFDKIINADSSFFTNYEKIGSGRGYLWSRSIPLMKDHIILGSGADSFIFDYPQNDYIGRFNNGYSTQIVTKPHNLFLQIGIQTGLLSLIAFLLFNAIYFVSSIKLYMNNKFDTYMSQLGAAIFVGTIGYMTAGLFNDSTITVSPVFWSLIGIGLAVNYQIKQSAQKA